MTSIVRRSAGVRRAVLVLALVFAIMAKSSGQAEAQAQTLVQMAPSVAQGLTFAGAASGVAYTAATGVAYTGAAAAFVAGGVAIAAVTTVVVGGYLIGWGAVESGLWGWVTGSDPEPATLESDTWVGDFGIEITGGETGWPNGEPHAWGRAVRVNWLAADGIDLRTGGNMEAYEAVQFNITAYCTSIGASGTSAWVHNIATGTITYPPGHTGTTNWLRCVQADALPEVVHVELAAMPDNGTEFVTLGTWQGGSGEAAEDRQLVMDVTCYSPDTGTTYTRSGSSDLYAPGNEPPSPRVACDMGDVITDANLRRVVVGDATKDVDLMDYAAPPEFSDPMWQYAQCVSDGCELMLYRDVAGTPQRCDDDAVVCVGWFDAPDQSEFTCMWGPNVMPLSDCDMFRDIDTPGYTAPDGVQQPVQQAPGTAGNPSHVEDGCIGFGDLLNPLAGLAKGVGCAMEWAFVPSAETMARAETIRTDLATRPPVSYITSVGEWFGAFGSIGTECFTVTHETSLGGTVDVLNSCDQSNGMVSFMTTNRTLFTVAVWLMFLAPFAWWAWATYAPGAQGDA